MNRFLILEIQGPMTQDLFELEVPEIVEDGRQSFVGRGKHRLEATMQAVNVMKAGCADEDRPHIQAYATRALNCLRQGTNDPMRVEGDPKLGTAMFAIIHLTQPKPR